MTKLWVSSSVLLFLLLGCAQNNKKNSSLSQGHLQKLSKQASVKRQNQQEAYLNRLVEAEKNRHKEKLRQTYKMPNPQTEESVYKEVLKAYQIRDLNQLSFFADRFVELYPDSIFADNSLYLLGQLQLAMGLPGDALQTFDRQLKLFPLGNKRAAAILGKGVAFRKLGLINYAASMLNEVKENYPGSAEYFKVDLEEKLLSVERAEQK